MGIESSIVRDNTRRLFEETARFCRTPGSVWLDSALRIGDRGGCSLMAVHPTGELRVGQTEAKLTHGNAVEYHPAPAWPELLEREVADPSILAVGFISYEAALPFVGLSGASTDGTVPEVHFLFYDRYQTDAPLPTLPDDTSPTPCEVVPSVSRPEYLRRVRRVLEYIREGDIYQANLTNRIDLQSEADPVDVYARLRHLSPAPYAAWLNFGDYQVLSSSPERMFLREGNQITTGPIKGTIAAGQNHTDREQNLARLLGSDKDKAELLMIVDLERNDLGRIALPGSVHVDSLFRPEVYRTVIHLVADVSATLRPDIGYGDIFRALLPGGSITGAPKRRAVEILTELESTPRSVYTGAIGYIQGNQADFNLAIRTMVHHDGVYRVHAGGGVVADSSPEAEYEEMLLKASAMLQAVGGYEEDLLR